MNLNFVVGSPSVKKTKNVISVENYKYRAISIFMNEVPDIKFLSVASECLKALAHPVRLRVLFLLETKRLTVGEIAKECDVVSHVASEHLRLMHRDAAFYHGKRMGKKPTIRFAKAMCMPFLIACEINF